MSVFSKRVIALLTVLITVTTSFLVAARTAATKKLIILKLQLT